jgi:D-tyrosyl-tRNA(Tyr) deacylase
MNRSLLDSGGEMLVVSQFTLLGDCRRGRRPSFTAAAAPQHAQGLYRYFVDRVRAAGVTVATGRFRAMMSVELVNEGPVTLIVESPAAMG